jgi:hypothetical protein
MTALRTDAPAAAPVEGDPPSERRGDRDREPRPAPVAPEAPALHPVRAAEPRAEDRDRDGEPDRGADQPVSDLRGLTPAQRAKLRQRLAAAAQLHKRASSDGEKAAALAACERIADRLGEAFDPDRPIDPDPDDRYGFKRDGYTYDRGAWRAPNWEAFFGASGRSFEQWVRAVQDDSVDIFAGWAARARARGWHENAVQAAQDYAAEYGVSPDDADLGM